MQYATIRATMERVTRKQRARSTGAGGSTIRRDDLLPKNPQTKAQLLALTKKQATNDFKHGLVKGLTPEQEAMRQRMKARRKKLTG